MDKPSEQSSAEGRQRTDPHIGTPVRVHDRCVMLANETPSLLAHIILKGRGAENDKPFKINYDLIKN
jgi:hypothetical protein